MVVFVLELNFKISSFKSHFYYQSKLLGMYIPTLLNLTILVTFFAAKCIVIIENLESLFAQKSVVHISFLKDIQKNVLYETEVFLAS